MTEGSDHDLWQKKQDEIVRQLRMSTGFTVRELALKTSRKSQSWSAYANGRPIPSEALQELIVLASAAPADLKQRAQLLLKHRQAAAAPSTGTAAIAEAKDPDVQERTDNPDRQKASAGSVPLSQRDPVSPSMTGSPVRSRKKKVIAVASTALAVVCTTVGYLFFQDDGPPALANAKASVPPRSVSPRTTPPSPAPRKTSEPSAMPSPRATTATLRRTSAPHPRAETSPLSQATPTAQSSPTQPTSTCQPRSQYKVKKAGNVVDENDIVVGNLVVDDLFIRDDETPGIPENPYRYYGTVKRTGVTGYVLQEKLTYDRQVCL